jgi:hypothetical protein
MRTTTANSTASSTSSPFDFLMNKLKQSFLDMPDKRSGSNISYTISDAASAAFSVFFTQEPSFLSYQKRMQQKYGTSNEQTVFAVTEIPSDTQMRRLLDGVEAKVLNRVFWDGVKYLETNGTLNNFRTTIGNSDLLVALDGTWYFSSSDIHCGNCLTKTHIDSDTSKEEKLYYHAMINPVIAVAGRTQVIPLPPEFIKNSDGEKKQDCEQNAAKRWIKKHGKKLSKMRVTILGDDLYAHQPICEDLLAQGFNFILVCKEDSHKTVYEWINGVCEEVRVEKITGVRKVTKETWIYRYVNEVPLRDQKGKSDINLKVNFVEITILDGSGRRKYKNAFVTNHLITEQNVEEIAACGRTRWKIENENNNTLKNQGYHLEHNFGHGKKHLASLLASLNILAFAFHTILEIVDKSYQAVREKAGRRDTLFNSIRTLLSLICFKSFESLMDFMLGLKKINAEDIENIHIPI